jgi:hypothetical protein
MNKEKSILIAGGATALGVSVLLWSLLRGCLEQGTLGILGWFGNRISRTILIGSRCPHHEPDWSGVREPLTNILILKSGDLIR